MKTCLDDGSLFDEKHVMTPRNKDQNLHYGDHAALGFFVWIM
ncbi:hypothetical protein EDC27_1035 [Desulfosoma caldarium]|uniref:Uncharacterized protein n=1 Tax=Desulfosoma caldarium TaxID=610254 RepID=A0A3N1VNP6_9BACT|nr:hypothetical protein EDC27_1035 [Desulfosoma caldarium]